MKKYMVTVVRTGCLFVEAESLEEAKDIADHQTTNTVNWDDSWEVTDCQEDDSLPSQMCLTERAFD